MENTIKIDRDLQNCATYIINGIVVDYFDDGKKPTLQDIKNNWQYLRMSGKNTINDIIITEIINRVSKYYN